MKISSTVEREPESGGKARQLVLFLHGVGADGNDLLSLSDIFAADLPDAHFISPNAPFACDMAPFGYQWFSLQDRTPEVMYRGVVAAAEILNDYIDQKLANLGLTDDNLIVIGFSQGTMTALYTLPRRAKTAGCLIGFSGAMIMGENLSNEIKSQPPICLIHGNADEVVPFAAMADAENHLQNAGVTKLETHEINNIGHGIDNEGIRIATKFISKNIV